MDVESNYARFGSGQSVDRVEDRALVTGVGRYTDDVTLENQAHLPHGRTRAAQNLLLERAYRGAVGPGEHEVLGSQPRILRHAATVAVGFGLIQQGGADQLSELSGLLSIERGLPRRRETRDDGRRRLD